jgi:hypothetical protein
MNAQVLNNPIFKFQQNERKAIAQAKACATHKWDQL